MNTNEQQLLKIIADAKEALTKAEAELNKLKEEDQFKRWMPKKGDQYYFFDGDVIDDDIWCDDELDNKRLAAFNVFKTKEDAQIELDITTMWRELRQFAKEENKGWVHDGVNNYENISTVNNKLKPDTLLNGRTGLIKFKESLSVQKAIEKFGDRLNLLNF